MLKSFWKSDAEAMFLLDANVLIAMAWTAHRAHGKAQAWFSRHASSGWATCPFTQAGFVRVLSNPAFSPNALTPRDALALLQSNLGHPAHRFWKDELTLLQAFENLAARLTGHQQITDAYLLRLAGHNGGKLATMDQSILALLPEKPRQRELIEMI